MLHSALNSEATSELRNGMNFEELSTGLNAGEHPKAEHWTN